jgi:hypothetical protein
MALSCKKCAGIIVAGTLVLSCAYEAKKERCPYLHAEPHALEDFYIPTQYKAIASMVATTAGLIVDTSVLHSYPDPDREGFTIHIIELK